MVAYSVLYTWFWVVTGGRLVIAVLLHSATNVAGLVLLTDARSDFGPTVIATVVTVAVAAVAARHLRRASHTSCEAIEREAAKPRKTPRPRR
ncbi:MAG: hypothetical protein M3Q48_17145 [Actinomycetota bacterium]|nr:hypothetical protein [Actinomycetota bacterium]